MATIINTIITFVVSTLLGYTLNALKNYKASVKEKEISKTKNELLQNKALLTLLKNDLTNTYFFYNGLKKIPDYVYQNFLDELEVYESLGGDGFVHKIAQNMESWELTKTDIL